MIQGGKFPALRDPRVFCCIFRDLRACRPELSDLRGSAPRLSGFRGVNFPLSGIYVFSAAFSGIYVHGQKILFGPVDKPVRRESTNLAVALKSMTNTEA